jgi:hypothetical protein
MQGDDTLVLGLNALGRAHQMDYFADGHRGAAILAAHYLCREHPVEPGVRETVQAMIDGRWAATPLCAPFPHESPTPERLAEIRRHIERSTDALRQAGHNVILPTLALRAFRDRPDAATPSRIDGICRLIDRFSAQPGPYPETHPSVPELDRRSAAAEFVLSELLVTLEAFDGRGQGWSGHLLTYGMALLDLQAMGFAATAQAALPAFRTYVNRIRMGPLETDIPRPEHPKQPLRPLERAYWERRKDGPLALGHLFKYPYAYYGLMALAQDAELQGRCNAAAYRIF